MTTRILLGVALLFANAFFVAAEFAVLAARATRIEPLAEQGKKRAIRALGAMRDLNLQLSGAQLGITMASLALGFVAEPAVDEALEHVVTWAFDLPEGISHTVSVVAALSIVVFLHIVFGEIVPKNVAISAPERTLLALTSSYQLYIRVFGPFVRALNGVAVFITRRFGIEPRDELHDTHSAQDIAALLSASHEEGLIEAFEHELLTGALDFAERLVTSVMVPWESVVTVGQDDPVSSIEAVVEGTGHTRLPMLGRGRAGAVVGFVHAKDLLQIDAGGRERPMPATLIRQLITLRPDAELGELLARMRQLRTHVAVVADATGLPTGLVTLEDLVEELVGEIRDETDPSDAAPASGAGSSGESI